MQSPVVCRSSVANENVVRWSQVPMTIGLLEQQDSRKWDDYVSQHPQGSISHLSAWQTLYSEAFNSQSFYIYVKRAGQICGVLPLISVRIGFKKHALISMPNAVLGGPLADDVEAANALVKKAQQMAAETGVALITLQEQHASINQAWSEPPVVHECVSLMQPTTEQCPSELTIKPGFESESFEHLYPFYVKTQQTHGLGVFPKAFAKRLCKLFPQHIHTRQVYQSGVLVGQFIGLSYQNRLYPFLMVHSDEVTRESFYAALHNHFVSQTPWQQWAWLDFGLCGPLNVRPNKWPVLVEQSTHQAISLSVKESASQLIPIQPWVKAFWRRCPSWLSPVFSRWCYQ